MGSRGMIFLMYFMVGLRPFSRIQLVLLTGPWDVATAPTSKRDLAINQRIRTYMYIYIYIYIYIYVYGYESKLCMERSALFRTYGTKGFRNWSCSGPLECDEIYAVHKYKYICILYILYV